MTGVWPAIAAGAVITALVLAWWGFDERRYSLRLRRRLRVVERNLQKARLEADDAERRISTYRDWADGHIQLPFQPATEDQEQ